MKTEYYAKPKQMKYELVFILLVNTIVLMLWKATAYISGMSLLAIVTALGWIFWIAFIYVNQSNQEYYLKNHEEKKITKQQFDKAVKQKKVE